MKLLRRTINEALRVWVAKKRRKRAAQQMDAFRAIVHNVSSKEVARWVRENREHGH